MNPGTILTRFHDGGSALVLRWWAFALVAAAFVPDRCGRAGGAGSAHARDAVVVALGSGPGSSRSSGSSDGRSWSPSWLADTWTRRRPPSSATHRDRVRSIHRLLGVGIGEHLGYLLTGLWSAALGLAILVSPAAAVPTWLASGVRRRPGPGRRVARIRRSERGPWMAGRRETRADRLCRLVGLARRPGDPRDPVDRSARSDRRQVLRRGAEHPGVDVVGHHEAHRIRTSAVRPGAIRSRQKYET